MEAVQGTNGGSEGHCCWLFNVLQIVDKPHSLPCDYETDDRPLLELSVKQYGSISFLQQSTC